MGSRFRHSLPGNLGWIFLFPNTSVIPETSGTIPNDLIQCELVKKELEKASILVSRHSTLIYEAIAADERLCITTPCRRFSIDLG